MKTADTGSNPYSRLIAGIAAAVTGIACGIMAVHNGLGASAVTAVIGGLAAMAALAGADILRSARSGRKTARPAEDSVSPDRIDPVTGLANQNGLMAWFGEKGARTEHDGKGIIVVAADLHGFEEIARQRGTSVSDSVLVELARRVSSCVGSDGIAARIEGGEFAAIATVVPNAFEEFAATQAGKLAELMQRPVELPSGVVWVGGSVGAAGGPVNEGKKTFANAKKALQDAKKIGIGHYVVYKNSAG